MRRKEPVSPAPLGLGLVAGIALQLQQPVLWSQASYQTLMALGLVLLALGRPRLPLHAALSFVCGLLLAFSQAGWRASAYAEQALAPQWEGKDIEVTGRIEGLPQPSAHALRFGFEVEQARLGDQEISLPPRLALSWYAGRTTAPPEPTPDIDATDGQLHAQILSEQRRRQPQPLIPGERWRLTVRLKAPHGQINPHGPDYELRLWEQGVQAVGYVRTAARHPAPVRLNPAEGAWIDRARLATRSAIVQRAADSSAAGVIAALVMGDQQAIERADWDVFRATGVAHLMSISGLHITMLAWLVTAGASSLWRRSAAWTPVLCLAVPAHVAGACAGLLLAWAYALYSGWAVPAQRTVLMLAVVISLRLLARQWPWPQIWLMAMVFILVADPWALMQAGFWLSFVAVGLLFATDVSGPHRSGTLRGEPVGALANLRLKLLGFFREQWVMTFALAPLTLLLFQQVSLVGLLANALAIPWVTLLVTPLGLLGLFWPALWDASVGLMEILMLALEPMARAPWAVMERPSAPWWCAAGGLLGGLLAVLRLPWGLRALGLAMLMPVLLWQVPRPPQGSFELLAVDVGQGSAVLIRTAHHSLLYDAGPRYSKESDAGHRVLVPLLRALGEGPDRLVLSHSDSDHVGGAAAVLARRQQMMVLSSLPQGHPLLAGPHPHQPCRAGQRWHWDGVDFEILHPSEAFVQPPRKPNTLSCVLLVSAGQERALLTGDLEAAQERELLQTLGAQRLQARWLLAPHHGSRTSSSAEFLDAVRPDWVVVQAGYRNRFGHPALPVLARYQERGIGVISTVGCGAARWRSHEPAQIRCQRQESLRYWHHRPAPVAHQEEADQTIRLEATSPR